jgi:hypothetical protein
MLSERDYMRSDYKPKKVKKKKEKYGINGILFRLYLIARFFRKKK